MAMLPGVQDYIAGGGDIQAQQGLQGLDIARLMEQQRQQIGQSLLGYLTDIQRDPFSIVPAMQAYGAAGGGTLAPAVALAQSGGAGQPSPYGEISSRLIRGLSEFAGATPVNPHTGMAMTGEEMDYLRKITGGDILRRGGTEQQAAIELARAEGNRQGINPEAYQLPQDIVGTQWPTGAFAGLQGDLGGTQAFLQQLQGAKPQIDQLNAKVQGLARKRPKSRPRPRPRKRPKSKYTSQVSSIGPVRKAS